MQGVDHAADELGPDWEEDTIYCEATCPPEDVFYQGSDDEEYDNANSRRQRCEAAGQRFLDGRTPYLISANLKGPFDKVSGWVNPWRSKHRTAGSSQGTRISPGKLARSAKVKRTVSISETVAPGPHDSLECHLPSPESLKQGSVTEAHPYLEDDELVMVQNWRSGVESVIKAPLVTTPRNLGFGQKRKAKESGWLKSLASKRCRTDLMESGSINTPIPQRTRLASLGANASGPDDGLNVSFSSVPEQLPSNSAAKKFFWESQMEVMEIDNQFQSADELDKLEHQRTTEGSSPKRISPVGDTQTSSIHQIDKAEGGLLPDNLAVKDAASSPLSEHPMSQTTSYVKGSPAIRQQSPDEECLPHRSHMAQTSVDGKDTEVSPVAQNASDPLVPQFETQEDESFCFKMRSNRKGSSSSLSSLSNVSMNETIVIDDAPNGSDEDTWSGLSSTEEENSRAEAIDDNALTLPPNVDTGSVTKVNVKHLSSELSSITSDKFEGFNINGASPDSIDNEDSTSESSSATSSDMDSDSSEVFMAEEIEVAVSQESINESNNDEMDDVANEPCGKSLDVPSTQDVAAQEGSPLVDSIPRQSSITTPAAPTSKSLQAITADEAQRTPSQLAKPVLASSLASSTASRSLLKSSIRNFVPYSSWDRLTHLTGTPTQDSPSLLYLRCDAGREPSSTPCKFKISSQRPAPTAHDGSSQPSRQLPHAATEPVSDTTSTVSGSQSTDSAEDESNLNTDAPLPSRIKRASPVPVSASQQSPWAGSKLSQLAISAIDRISENQPLLETHQEADDSTNACTSPVQTPWVEDTLEASTPTAAHQANGKISNHDPQAQASEAMTPLNTRSMLSNPADRPSTPEPQFSVKSFASFMSPSPEPRPCPLLRATWEEPGSRLPNTQDIISSTTSNPWKSNSRHRVSWAPLPHEATNTLVTPSPLLAKGRTASPPPESSMTDLSTSETLHFTEHFNAVARRTNLSQRLLPTESQRTVGSPSLDAMAETFLTADHLRKPSTDPAKSDDQFGDSQDPLDMVADVFREMGDFLDKWNMDVEPQNRPSPEKTRLSVGAQSPW